MGLNHEHELHRRRLGRNAGLGLALGAFVVLVMAVTMVKLEHAAELKRAQRAAEAAATEAGR